MGMLASIGNFFASFRGNNGVMIDNDRLTPEEKSEVAAIRQVGSAERVEARMRGRYGASVDEKAAGKAAKEKAAKGRKLGKENEGPQILQ